MTKSAATQSDTTTVGAQLIAPEASPEQGQKGGVSGWRECKLDNAPLEIVDGDRGKNYPSQNEFFDVGHCLFLSTKNVRFNGFDFSDCQFITREKDELLRKGKLRRNDVILTTRGTVGNLGFYGDSIAYENVRINSGMVIIRPNTDNLYPLFNFYLFRHLQSDFQTHTSGSAQPQLPIRDLKEMYVSIPPLPEQKAIAAVLSSLDDKIDLLYRQNQTLEAMAQTLFRQWFIEEAREDWEEVTLANLCKVITKGTTPTTLGHSFVDVGVNFIKAESITDDGGFIKEKFAKINLETHKLLNRSVILKSDILCSIAGTIGRVAMVEDWILPANTNQAIAILRTNEQRCFPQFIYLFLKSSSFQDAMDGKIVHAVQPNLSLGQIGSTNLRLPPYGYLCDFVELVKPMFEKKTMNLIQIQTLAQLRDTLLPKLMSGEIRVEVEYE